MTNLENIAVLRKVMHENVLEKHLRNNSGFLKLNNTELIACHLIRVYPRQGDKFLLQLELSLQTPEGSTKQQAWGELVGGGVEEHYQATSLSLRKSRRRQLSGKSAETMIFCLSELGIVIRFAGLDERLNGLKLLQKPKKFLPVLASALGLENNRVDRVKVEFLGHRLGKRCIARVSYREHRSTTTKKQPNSIIAKLYKGRDQRCAEVYQLMNSLWQNGFDTGNTIRIPKPLAHIEEWNMVLMEDVQGSLLTKHPSEMLESSLSQTGEALAKFHRTKLKVDGSFTAEDEISLLESWVSLVAAVFPMHHSPLTKALEQLQAELKDINNIEPSLAHRDFYEKQVLLQGANTTIIDFDTTCLADPAIDLGNFLAHLILLSLQGIELPANANDFLLSGYGLNKAHALYSRVITYKRTTLVRLACLYSFWPQWRHLTSELLRAFKNIE